jgi:adenylate kinase
MVEARLKQPDTRRGWLMDGFPRTLPQAEGLREMTDRIGQRVDAAVILRVSHEVIVKRLSGRNRQDDTPEVVRKRIDVFEKQTRPVFDFFRQHYEVVDIDAARSIDQVTEALRVGLDRFDHS